MEGNAVDTSNDQTAEMLRYDGAAALTGIKIPTLQSMVCRKEIPHFRLGKRLVVFSKSELAAWMNERRIPSR